MNDTADLVHTGMYLQYLISALISARLFRFVWRNDGAKDAAVLSATLLLGRLATSRCC